MNHNPTPGPKSEPQPPLSPSLSASAITTTTLRRLPGSERARLNSRRTRRSRGRCRRGGRSGSAKARRDVYYGRRPCAHDESVCITKCGLSSPLHILDVSNEIAYVTVKSVLLLVFLVVSDSVRYSTPPWILDPSVDCSHSVLSNGELVGTPTAEDGNEIYPLPGSSRQREVRPGSQSRAAVYI